jgi:hypothetical protein
MKAKKLTGEQKLRQDVSTLLPKYKWTLRKGLGKITAEGIMSSGFNRISTMQVIYVEGASYEVKTRGYGLQSTWERTVVNAKTLRGAVSTLRRDYGEQARTATCMLNYLNGGG